MFQNDLLDLAIGLVFAWFVLSLVVSVVNEALVLAFRVRAKHLWLAIGRMVDPAEGRYARRFGDTIRLLFNVGRGLDLRPAASASSSDPQGIFANRGLPAATPTELQLTLQRIYDGMAPRVSDVAREGRRSKLTSVPPNVFAKGIAAIAKPVHPNDLRNAADQLQWAEDRKQFLDAALPKDVSTVLGLDEVIRLGRDQPTREEMSALYERASTQGRPVHRVELVGAAIDLHWSATRLRRLAEAVPDPSAVLSRKKTLALNLAPAIGETDIRDLYLRASDKLTGDHIADFFRKTPHSRVRSAGRSKPSPRTRRRSPPPRRRWKPGSTGRCSS